MSNNPDPAQPPEDQGPLSPAGVAALKFAVVAMGIMIVVGVAVVIGRIIYLAGTKPATTTASAPAGLLRQGDSATLGQIGLPTGTHAKQVSLDGRNLVVLYEGSGLSGVIIVDAQSGQTISQLRFAPAGVPTEAGQSAAGQTK
jgi:hypothetical protein